MIMMETLRKEKKNNAHHDNPFAWNEIDHEVANGIDEHSAVEHFKNMNVSEGEDVGFKSMDTIEQMGNRMMTTIMMLIMTMARRMGLREAT
jgi:hypothetical protein